MKKGPLLCGQLQLMVCKLREALQPPIEQPKFCQYVCCYMYLLFIAAGMSEVCALLCHNGADVNAHDSLGMTTLHIAVNTFHPDECVTLVSELAADVNAVDVNHHSPLFVAVSQNATDLVAFLLQSGATPDKQDKDMMR